MLRTERIELRPMTPAHLPLLHRLDSDPEVMRYLLGRARTPEEIDAFWAPRCADTVADAVGLGWWVGFRDGEFLGWWDLGRSDSAPGSPPAPDEAEIGWRVARAHWGQGLATEGARALVAHGFGTVGLRRVWAETMAVNSASRAVMRKIGMRHVATSVREWENPLPGSEAGEVTYEITAPEWAHQRETEPFAMRTERLDLRPCTRHDATLLAELYADGEVSRFIGGDRLTAPGAARSQAERFAGVWERRGHGQSVVVERSTGDVVGRVGLHPWPEWGELELGWVLARRAWHRGLAHEAADAWLEWARRAAVAPYLIAVIHPDNAASIRLAERLGFRRDREETTPWSPAVVYRHDLS